MVSFGIKKIVSADIIENVIKSTTRNSVLSVSYVVYKDISNLDINTSSKNFFDKKSICTSVISEIFSIPVYEYSKEKIAVNVANELEMQYFYTSIYEENTNEGKETFDKSGVTEENDNSDDKNEQESKDKINNNEQSTNEESNMDIENNTDNTENVNGIGKIKDIKVEDLTYEYLMENFYTVVSSTTLKKEDINAEELMAIDMKIKSGNSSPQILIYHTHSQEAFADSIEGDTSTTIVGVGDYLTKLLTEQYGYNVIHITDSFDYVNGVFDRHKAYDYAYEKVAQVLADNPSIEVVIDLHRDGVAETTHLVTEIDGKPTAKIMFFNGISRLNDVGEIGYLYNPYRKENLAFSLQMKVLAEEYYEGFARRNYIQAYQYNLHLRPKSTLIEVGAQTNTLEEELNAMNPLAKILDMTLS
jgi:stage II sporulation protein P